MGLLVRDILSSSVSYITSNSIHEYQDNDERSSTPGLELDLGSSLTENYNDPELITNRSGYLGGDSSGYILASGSHNDVAATRFNLLGLRSRYGYDFVGHNREHQLQRENDEQITDTETDTDTDADTGEEDEDDDDEDDDLIDDLAKFSNNNSLRNGGNSELNTRIENWRRDQINSLLFEISNSRSRNHHSHQIGLGTNTTEMGIGSSAVDNARGVGFDVESNSEISGSIEGLLSRSNSGMFEFDLDMLRAWGIDEELVNRVRNVMRTHEEERANSIIRGRSAGGGEGEGGPVKSGQSVGFETISLIRNWMVQLVQRKILMLLSLLIVC
ncbi:unnamed protein product [Ambrosiozyma monospora]|uniref:Unnamed protein product n=1 Tax=Ambrosiozyma monospora TaxID=43982 RepID=A0ACB5U0Y5_AMBMO|nr:unnamed protein product [Ambrosiozyma monospora]